MHGSLRRSLHLAQLVLLTMLPGMRFAAATLPDWVRGPADPPVVAGDADRTIAESFAALGETTPGWGETFNGGAYGDAVGMFFGAMASGEYARAATLRRGACAAWRTMPPDNPFTGRLRVEGEEVSLDRVCGPRP